MDSINTSDFPLLVEAVIVWTGWGKSAMPGREDSLLVIRFGTDIAAKLRPSIKSLEDDFYSSDAWQIAANLPEMGEMAAEHFRMMHPEIPLQIFEAFTWCYTYDYK